MGCGKTVQTAYSRKKKRMGLPCPKQVASSYASPTDKCLESSKISGTKQPRHGVNLFWARIWDLGCWGFSCGGWIIPHPNCTSADYSEDLPGGALAPTKVRRRGSASLDSYLVSIIICFRWYNFTQGRFQFRELHTHDSVLGGRKFAGWTSPRYLMGLSNCLTGVSQ